MENTYMTRDTDRMHESRRDLRQLFIVGSLVFSSGVCVLLLLLRVGYSRSGMHTGMIWNLFLAWLPMICSLMAFNLARQRKRGNWLIIGGCALVWLLFFPNAPYILTDIGNLRQRNVPLWYDVLMFVAFAWNGTFLGLVSLYLMQALVRRARGAALSWVFVVGVLFLGSFGVYLGRFPRYNSWDVFTNPMTLLTQIWELISHPLANSQMYVFSALFALLLLSVYLMMVAFMQFQRDPPRY